VNFNGNAVNLNGQPWMSEAQAVASGMALTNFQNLTTTNSRAVAWGHRGKAES